MPYKDKNKNREWHRLWMRRRRADFFMGKVCAQCGSGRRLELDHIDPEEKEHHGVWSWSSARRARELAKCQVLCHVCHLAKTKAYRRRHLRHGMLAYYTAFKCRCRPCVVASYAMRKMYRKAGSTKGFDAHKIYESDCS